MISVFRVVIVCFFRFPQKSSATQQQLANRGDDAAQILADAKVLEAKDHDSSRTQRPIAVGIRARVVMRSVELDRDLRPRTIEVDDDGAERMLAANRNPKARSSQLGGPEDGFFRRRISSELTGEIEHVA